MRPARGAVTIDLLLWVAGTLLAIFFFIGMVWPWLLSIWYGSCWADARTDLREFGSEIEGAIRGPGTELENYRLTIGSCIGGVVFINGKDYPDAPDFLKEECSEYTGYKSYMVVVPKEIFPLLNDEGFLKKIGKKVNSFWEALSVWDKITLYLKEKMGKVPPTYCYEFEHDFSSTEGTIKSIPAGFWDNIGDEKNWNTGAEPYCLDVAYVPASDGYNYAITQKACPAKEEE